MGAVGYTGSQVWNERVGGKKGTVRGTQSQML